MEIFLRIAGVAGGIVTFMTLLSLIIKPLRHKIIDAVMTEHKNTERDQIMQDIKTQLDKILINDEEIKTRLSSVEEKVLRNERDRLQQELFDCGARCRRSIPLFPEEMDRIRECYSKYANELHANGIGHMEYEFIHNYYNNQNFDNK